MTESKIFGVGLSRTGTTSLTSALNILGYKSIHYPDYYLDKDFKIKIQDYELEKYETLTDVPVAYLFRELDALYPGSKFILTIRDEKTWLESVSKFFTRPEGNSSKGFFVDFLRCLKPKNKKWRSNYLLRRAVYGSFKYNNDLYLKRYRKHNQEVINYFKGREDDFIVVNILAENNKWEKICNFLNINEPKEEFPHNNKISSKQ